MSKTKLAVSVLAVLTCGGLSQVCAQTMPPTPSASSQQNGEAMTDTNPAQITKIGKPQNVKKLKAITVTGSLIPQTEIETATPIVTITSAQMKARGFTSVTQALQQASFSTGSVQGMQDTNSFSTGAETLSMFGLPIGFTKYLINGRPMGNFPGLYNGSDAFNSISGIPMDLVDHVDILPGGQSSLYGSDAIAGVINIVLKKSVDAPTIDVRYGWHSDGGGADSRISLADSFSMGKWTSLVGMQFENVQPIWARDRSLTDKFSNGQGAPLAAPDYLVTSIFTGQYYFQDPNNCSTLSGQWNGTLAKQHRPGVGDWCGSLYTPGVATIANGQKTVNLYTHNTFDINDHTSLYGDLLYNYQEQKWSSGSSITDWNNLAYIGPFYDPRLDAEGLEIRHEFSPEEVGGYQNIMSEQIENSYMLTLGVQGTLGQSNWDYDLGFTHSDDKLNNHSHQRFQSMEDYYDQHVMGPQLGTYDGLPVFEPNYAALYQPVSKATFDSFTGYTNNYSKTWDNLLRGQLTNASLFPLPGGDAGVAVALEGGNEGWSIDPDPRYAMGDVWGSYVTPGAGHRSRFAATTEFRLPVLPRVTLDVSGRYDDYKVSGDHVAHPTYNLGLEYRPVDSFLLRGRYGTAFKAPTLADEFQAPSGSGTYIMDYLNCNRQGSGGVNFANCKPPYDSVLVEDETTGNPALKPITAKVWSYGFVWAPLDRMSISVDYLHWSISNEVTQTSADQLSNTEYLCDIGTINPSSALCTEASSLITRSPIAAPGYLGAITTVSTPKLNLANELVNAVTATFNYAKEFGQIGDFDLAISYSDVLKHTTQAFPTDPSVDLLRNPNYSTDFKSKINGSITWSKNEWSATLYGNRYGGTPNNLATQLNSYAEPGTGKLAPWILYNASVTYHPMPKLALSLSVNNLFNKMPPVDTTYGNGPAPYNTDDYNVFGRAIFLEANYKFANK